MIRFVIILALLAIGFILWLKVSKAPKDQRKKIKFQIFAGAVVALMIFLAVTGRLNILYAAIGSLVAFIPRIAGLLKFLPLINKIRQAAGQQQNSSTQANASSAMNKDKAYEVLGLKPEASKEEIIAAHKKMMQKVHPDRGGSDYLGAEINTAKDTLLG